ncbi:MAG TPA: hydroxypyruvate isomerase [Planctomycetaceae bacterium]|nr:hydroxypyruvate isomerase [Planctomycetaceae bacterium]
MKRPDGTFPSDGLTRRRLLVGAASVATAGLVAQGHTSEQPRWDGQRGVTKGRIKQSVAAWCFKSTPLERLARNAAAMGIASIELVDPKDWPILKRHGLICALANSHGFVKGWNHPENHAMCEAKIRQAAEACAEASFPNVITFSGFRNGMPDDVGLEHTVRGLKKVVGYAEKRRVNLILEVLNSRVDEEMKGHPGYMGDSIEWCVEVCRRIGSERLKILFDIYHVQIMQGDIITRIRQFKDYIGHYHTAGVPGRNEIDQTQELNYGAIMKAVAETGFDGYVAQEFIPTRDPMTSLWEAVRLCDV